MPGEVKPDVDAVDFNLERTEERRGCNALCKSDSFVLDDLKVPTHTAPSKQ